MSDLRKAAEMALEALGEYTCVVTSGTDPTKWNEIVDGGGPARKAIEALRQALEEQEAFTLDRGCWERGCVAYDERDGDGVMVYVAPVNISQERVDETAKREHEHVAYVTIEPAIDGDWRKVPSIKWFDKPIAGPLYAAPPKKEWVGLTDDEMRTLKQKSVDDGMIRIVSDFEYIRSIEAKLKEKNT